MTSFLLKRAQQGFGLIEMMMVVAIIAIMAAVAIPEYGALREKAQKTQGTILMNTLEKQQMAYMAFYDRFATLDELGGWSSISTASASGSSGNSGDGGGAAGNDHARFGRGAEPADEGSPAQPSGGAIKGKGIPAGPVSTPAPSPGQPSPTPDNSPQQAFNYDSIFRATNIATSAVAWYAGSAGTQFGQNDIQTTAIPGTQYCLVQWFLSADKKDVMAYAVKPVKQGASFYSKNTTYHYMALLSKVGHEAGVEALGGDWVTYSGFFGNGF